MGVISVAANPLSSKSVFYTALAVASGCAPAANAQVPDIGKAMPYTIAIDGAITTFDSFTWRASANMRFEQPPWKGLTPSGVGSQIQASFTWEYGSKGDCKVTQGSLTGESPFLAYGQLYPDELVGGQPKGLVVGLMIPAATETWKVKCGRNFEQDIPDPGALFSLLANPLTAGGPKPFKGGEPKEGVWKVAETPCDLGEGPAPPVAPESAPWKMKVEKSSRKGMRELTAMLETIQDVKQDVANGWVVGLTAPGYAAEADNATIENFSWMRLANPRADVVLTGGLKGQCLRVRLVKLRLRPVQIFLAREIENDLCQRNRVRAHEIEHFNRMSAHSREFLSDARSQVTKLLSNGQMLPRASFPIYIETGKAEEVLHQFGALIVQNLLLEVSRSVADEQVAWDKADKIVKGGICDPWPQPQIPWLRPP